MFNYIGGIVPYKLSFHTKSRITNLYSSESGVGTSFFASLLQRCCDYRGIPNAHITYGNYELFDEKVPSTANGIVIFDNVEVYIDLLPDMVRKCKCDILIVGRSFYDLDVKVPMLKFKFTERDFTVWEE